MILTLLHKQVQQTGTSKLDCKDEKFKLSVLQMKAVTDYSDDGDAENVSKKAHIIAKNASCVTLSTDDRINLCEKSFKNVTSYHDLRESILASTRERVREENHLMERQRICSVI